MLNNQAYDALDNSTKYHLYQDAIQNMEFMKSVITELSRKIPTPVIVSNVPKSSGEAAHTSQLHTLHAGNVSNQHLQQVPLAPQSGKTHLFLPRVGDFKGLILGDSITNRLNAEQVGPSILARGFGGAKILDISQRVEGSHQKHFDHVTLCIGINDCMHPNFDVTEALARYEKLIYLAFHKFSPKGISVASITPLGNFRKHQNVNVINLNDGLSALISRLTDLPTDFNIRILDLHKIFTESTTPSLSSDGLHPSLHGVTALVTAHRATFENLGFTISNATISMKERPAQTVATDKSRATDQLVNSMKLFMSTVNSPQ